MAPNRQVRYVDFGFTSAAEFWREIAMPAYDRFTATQNRQTAIDASVHAWHVHEWIWHDENPGIDTQGNSDYRAFRDGLIDTCPELAWVRDVADAGKHRGLGRRDTVVQGVGAGALQQLIGGDGSYLVDSSGHFLAGYGGLELELTDGSRYPVATVLATVVAFWESRFGP